MDLKVSDFLDRSVHRCIYNLVALVGNGEDEVSPGGVGGYTLSLVPSSLSALGYQEVSSSALPCPPCHDILHHHKLKGNGPEDHGLKLLRL